MSSDDLLRRDVITQLICLFSLDIKEIEKQYGINFRDYFSIEQSDLAQLEKDGLILCDEQKITVLPEGRFLIRNICMTFDKYMRNKKDARFSKVI